MIVVITRHNVMSWAQIITKIALQPGLCHRPRWESSPRGRFARGGGKGKEEKKERERRNDENGLLCPEFLTWKVGNPMEATNFKFDIQIDYRELVAFDMYW